jgi:hypothetical protein
MYSSFESQLDGQNLSDWVSLDSPIKIQGFLDNMPYIGEEMNRTPLQVMQDHQCHCLDGGMLAALALRRIGYASRLIDLVPEPGLDDDHVLAIFQVNGKYGAVAKSNFVGLRFRDPVFRSLRELVMSYFDIFWNLDRVKTLRGYTRPLDLSKYDRFDWETTQTGKDKVINKLYSMKMIPVVSNEEFASLALVDERSYQAGIVGTNLNETYKLGQAH